MPNYSCSTENTESLYDEETGGLKRNKDSLPSVRNSQTSDRRYDDLDEYEQKLREKLRKSRELLNKTTDWEFPSIDHIDEQMLILGQMDELLESYYLNRTITRRPSKIPSKLKSQDKPPPAKNTAARIPRLTKENKQNTKRVKPEIAKIPSMSPRTSLTGSRVTIHAKRSYEKPSCASCPQVLPKLDKTNKKLTKPKSRKYAPPPREFLFGRWRF